MEGTIIQPDNHYGAKGFLGKPSPMLSYAAIVFFIALGDAIMSYVSPVYIEEFVHSTSAMGIVFATSSAVGFVADLVLGEWFKGKKYSFFIFWTSFLALCFPATLLLFPPIVPIFILAMAIWGIYYELILFSDYHFINSYTTRETHSQVWGLLSIIKSLGYVTGPIIAGVLLTSGYKQTFTASLGIYFLAIVGLMMLFRMHKQKRTSEHADVEVEPKRNMLHEIKVWKLLGARIWPLLAFSFVFFLVDSTFWGIGTILAEQVKEQGAPGELILTLYTIPALFAGLMAPKIEKLLGKKRGAFLSGGLSALFLLPIGFTENAWILFALVFFSSLAGASALPLINATYADYLERLGQRGNNLIGLNGAATSISYVIGPIVSGIIADIVGIRNTFSLVGLVYILAAIVVWIATPHKIRMPQQELEKLESEMS